MSVLPVKQLTSENTFFGPFLSVNNSSVALLGISGVFTGTADDLLGCAEITVSIFSNRASASLGASFQFSSDGTNWDYNTQQNYTYAASGKFSESFAPKARFFRIVFTNGALAQASFRLQTIYRTASSRTPLQIPGTWSIGLDTNNTDASPSRAQTVNARLHQVWSPEHPENSVSATGEFFPQNQSDTGELHTSLTTVRGLNPVEVGHGTTEAVAKTFPTRQKGSPRVATCGTALGTLSNVSASASSTTLVAANTARGALTIYNDSSSAMYVKVGSAASATSFTEFLPPYATVLWTEKCPTQIITGIWDVATGTARVTEFS